MYVPFFSSGIRREVNRRCKLGRIIERLEARCVLAVTSSPDAFTAIEDQTFELAPTLEPVSLQTPWHYTTANVDPAQLDPDFATTWYTQGLPGSIYDGPAFSTGFGAFAFGGVEAIWNTVGTSIYSPLISRPEAQSLWTNAAYFWRTFEFDGDPARVSSLVAKIIADDGAFIYINGEEVGRINMGDRADGFGVRPLGAINESQFAEVNLANRLVAGVNTIAVSVHNVLPTSEDMGFDMRLRVDQLLGSVLANDASDAPPPDDLLRVVEVNGQAVVQAPVTVAMSHGSVTMRPNGTFAYTPASGYVGTDSFTYRAADAQVSGDIATVTVNVVASNDPPIAAPDSYTLDEDTVLSVASGVEHLLLSRNATWDFFDDLLNGSELTVGHDYEDYPLDGLGRSWIDPAFDTSTSDPAIGVWQSGAGPFAQGDITGFAGLATTALGETAEEHTTDLFRSEFTLTAEQALYERLWIRYLFDDGGILFINGQEVRRFSMIAGAVTTNTLANLPDNNVPTEAFHIAELHVDGLLVPGLNTIAFELHQVTVDSSDRGFSLELFDLNPTVAGVLSNDRDVENHRLTAELVSPPAHGVLELNADGSFSYTPTTDYYGSDSFTYRAVDNGTPSASSAPVTVTLNVTNVPDTLVVRDDSYTVDEDESLAALQSTDVVPLGSTWEYLIPVNGQNPALVDPDYGATWYRQGMPGVVYDGPFFRYGAAPFAYGGILYQDPPTTQLDYPGVSQNYSAYFVTRFAFDGDPATVTDLVADIVADDGAFIYLNGAEIGRLNMAASAVDTFTALTPQQGVEDRLTTIPLSALPLVQGDNLLAVSVHSSNRNNEDLGFEMRLRVVRGGMTASVLANDSSDDAPLLATLVSGPAHGTLEFLPSGNFLYVPNPQFHGVDTFRYRATDGVQDTSEATVTINVSSVPDAPMVVVPPRYATREDTPLALSLAAAPASREVVALDATWTYTDAIKDAGVPGAPRDYPVDPAHPGASWNSPAFSTATSTLPWQTHVAPFAVGDVGTTGWPIDTNNVTTTLFRTTFNLTAAEAAAGIRGTMRLFADDGGIFYVNGHKVLRVRMPDGPVTPQTLATSPGPESLEQNLILDLSGWLTPGENVLAFELHQAAPESNVRDLLRVSEIMYNPPNPTAAEMAAGFDDHDDFEFLEVVNVSDRVAISLSNVTISQGFSPDFVFGDATLAPGERAVVVRDLAAFRFRYGDGPRVLGQYSGGLSNSGEPLAFATFGTTFLGFVYGDDNTPGWPADADGEGRSLVIVDPTANVSAWSQPTQWRASTADGGSPGAIDFGEPVPHATLDAAFSASLKVDFTGGVLASAIDYDDQPLAAVLLQDAKHGHVALNADGTFTYTPDRNFFGEDYFVYVAQDNDASGALASAPTMTTITVHADSSTPECEDFDYDQNGVVDQADALGILARFGATVLAGSEADYNQDGAIGVLDVIALRNRFGMACDGVPSSHAATSAAAAIVHAAHAPSRVDAAISSLVAGGLVELRSRNAIRARIAAERSASMSPTDDSPCSDVLRAVRRGR